jgi:hypothetical protein
MPTAVDGGKPNYPPLSFMIFQALRSRSEGWRAFVERSIALGIDPVVNLAVAALERLGPDGLIPSPVDNIRGASETLWRKVLSFIDAWKHRVGKA